MSTRRAPRPIRAAAQFTVALLAVIAIFVIPTMLIALSWWWAVLIVAGILFAIVIRGRMWGP